MMETNYYKNDSDFSMKKGTNNYSPAIRNMVSEGGEPFLNYMKRFGIASEPNIMVLSSRHHYYYDSSELQSIRALVNLKKLNMIRHLDLFLQTLSRMLPSNASFIGCFSDSTGRKRNYSISRYAEKIICRIRNFMDSKTDRSMDKDDVSKLFESYGFKIVDMTEINGQTFFNTQKN